MRAHCYRLLTQGERCWSHQAGVSVVNVSEPAPLVNAEPTSIKCARYGILWHIGCILHGHAGCDATA
jgi:hypothetical protein